MAGARYIPGDVTVARRLGQRVVFHPERHEWTFPDGRVAPSPVPTIEVR